MSVDERGESERDDEGDAVSLLRLAGPRDAPSPEQARAARAHVHAAWRAGVRRRRLRQGALWAAAAALVALAVAAERGGPGGTEPGGPPALVLAHLDATAGLVEREDASGWARLAAGEAVLAPSRIRTGADGAGLRAPDGRSLRLDAFSRLRFEAPDRLTLEAGAVYLDSGRGGRSGSAFEVRTTWGTVRESGTQFEVRLETAGLRVRVREGLVTVGGEAAAAGTELRLDASGVTRRALPVHGPEWSWVLRLAPAFEMEGRSLDELVGWAAREAGWELRYLDAESQRRSREAVLHGSIRGARPDEAALAVIPTSGLRAELRDGVLRVGPVGEARDGR